MGPDERRELHRVEVLQSVQARRQTVTAAAQALGISWRQAQRLAKAYRSDGAAGLRHKGHGQRSNRALSEALRELAVSLVRERYGDFRPHRKVAVACLAEPRPRDLETRKSWTPGLSGLTEAAD